MHSGHVGPSSNAETLDHVDAYDFLHMLKLTLIILWPIATPLDDVWIVGYIPTWRPQNFWTFWPGLTPSPYPHRVNATFHTLSSFWGYPTPTHCMFPMYVHAMPSSAVSTCIRTNKLLMHALLSPCPMWSEVSRWLKVKASPFSCSSPSNSSIHYVGPLSKARLD